DTYGPAPKEWFGVDRKPLAQYAAQVPHTQTKYDEGMTGLAVAYYVYNASSKTLTGAPKLHTTNLGGLAGTITRDWGTTPPIAGATEWGFRATGTMRLPLNGNYRFRIGSDSGVRMWIDDKLVINDWNDGFIRDHADYIFNNVANSAHRV